MLMTSLKVTLCVIIILVLFGVYAPYKILIKFSPRVIITVDPFLTVELVERIQFPSGLIFNLNHMKNRN